MKTGIKEIDAAIPGSEDDVKAERHSKSDATAITGLFYLFEQTFL